MYIKITKFIFLELETVIENTCAETTRDPAACVRCASFLADRKACEAEEDEDGHAICKFVKNESDPPGYCVVNAADGNGSGSGSQNNNGIQI